MNKKYYTHCVLTVENTEDFSNNLLLRVALINKIHILMVINVDLKIFLCQ